MKEYRCPWSGVPVDLPVCEDKHPACRTCGWNPKVHARRVRQIRALEREGRLQEWGKEKA